jgi:hypothetical protein
MLRPCRASDSEVRQDLLNDKEEIDVFISQRSLSYFASGSSGL